MKKMFTRLASIFAIGCIVVSQAGLVSAATAREKMQESASSITVNSVLSSEYLLVDEGGILDGARISLVAEDIEAVESEDQTADVLGMVYYKEAVPFPYGMFSGTVAVNDDGNYELEATWVNAYYAMEGVLSMTFEVAEASGGAYEVYGDGYLNDDTFTFGETARGKYIQKEAEELSEEIALYMSGEATYSPGKEIPPIGTMFDTEFVLSDGYRFVMMHADEEMLAQYNIDPNYDTVGVIYYRGSVPTFDSVMFGNLIEMEDRYTFDGAWVQASGNSSNMYVDFKVRMMTDTNDLDGDGNTTEGNYYITGNGDWWISYDFDLDQSDNFVLGESFRARYAKHEAQELEEELYAYIEDNEEEVENELEEIGDLEEEDVEDVEDDNTENVEDVEDTDEDSGECNPFKDVSSSYEYCESIEYVKDQGIVKGYPDGTFKPTNTVNRAEFAKIVIGATYTEEEMTECLVAHRGEDFSDVPRNQWFAKYICVAKQEGIIGGYADGSFQPTRQIALSEAAKIISLAFDLEVSSEDSDPWYMKYINALSAENAIPLSFDTFDQAVERGEMAEMIQRLHAPDSSKDSETYESLAGVVTEDTEATTEDEGTDTEDTDASSVTTFEASLRYANSNVTTQAMGYGTFSLEGRTLSYQIDLDNLYNEVSGAHFHNYSNYDAVEATIVTFEGDSGSGNWSTSGVWENLTDAQIEYLMEGAIYVNVHTNAYPDGEIMGHVLYVK